MMLLKILILIILIYKQTKKNHQDAIEVLDSVKKVQEKTVELQKLNAKEELAKKVKEAQDYFDNNQNIFNAATLSKQTAFSTALQNAKDVVSPTATLQEVQKYEELKKQLTDALNNISANNVLNDLREALKEKVKKFIPPFIQEQSDKLVKKIRWACT
ncbi:hypothetical protein [Mycoplasma struthionis]|uniref:Uncharacterized protein n=1 Tax=Mycoplasma struthionis TaxID=538220 RepID=A0A502M2Z1_9MOLU|nr:hypothetical protein [Mycoplasma struthionis]TPI02809.1 hypothetical protein FJM01_00240 [Mycoplasma struthionis]